MKTEQISVFLENRAGRLADVTHALAEAQVSIRALSLADTSDFGILRLLVAEHEKAKSILKEKGFTFGCTSVVPVEVADRPGGLDDVLQLVSQNGINVEYMYSLIQRDQPQAIMIFRFDKIDMAISLLEKHNFHILSTEQLYGKS
ncbi:MAG: ACT domain-containing protein [Desulfovibrio sp.]|nr:ACT domain-containing protein [Desulfovibrio sp.]